MQKNLLNSYWICEKDLLQPYLKDFFMVKNIHLSLNMEHPLVIMSWDIVNYSYDLHILFSCGDHGIVYCVSTGWS